MLNLQFKRGLLAAIVLLNIISISAADTNSTQSKNVLVAEGVIEFFPKTPKEGIIARYQLPGKEIWVGAVRTGSKTRQVRITSYHGARGSKTLLKFIYPFGTNSATWNMDVTRKGDIVTVDLPWNGSLIGELMDVNDGADKAASVREKLGVTGPASKELPVLYSSGDSISMGCWPYLEGELWKEMNVYYQRELWKDIPAARSPNNGHAHLAYKCLQKAYETKKFKPDYTMANFGLHMITTHKDKQKKYGQWVQKFIDLAKKKDAEFIWVTTTPYASFRTKQNITIRQFNAIAVKIAEENKVPVIDLHNCIEKLVNELGEDKVYTDGVHFTEDIKQKQGKFIANRIREIIKKKECTCETKK